jgi:hypothetical protein
MTLRPAELPGVNNLEAVEGKLLRAATPGLYSLTKPPLAVTAVSRLSDAPRRIYHNLGF